MKKFKIIAIAAVLILIIIVILQNAKPVNTQFLFWTFPLPRALLLFLTFVLGFVAGLLVAIRFEGKSRKKQETASSQGK